MAGQASLHRSRREAFFNEVSILKQRIAQFGKQIHGYTGQARSRTDRLHWIRCANWAGRRVLSCKGLSPKTKVRALERAAAVARRGAVEGAASNIARVQEEIIEAQLQMSETETRSNKPDCSRSPDALTIPTLCLFWSHA